MGATNLTPNIHLPLFVASDKPSWLGDVNEAMSRIDADSGTQTAAINLLTTQLNAANATITALTARVTALETRATTDEGLITAGDATQAARITALALATGHVGI